MEDKRMILWKKVVRIEWKVDESGSRLYPIVGFGISGVEQERVYVELDRELNNTIKINAPDQFL